MAQSHRPNVSALVDLETLFAEGSGDYFKIDMAVAAKSKESFSVRGLRKIDGQESPAGLQDSEGFGGEFLSAAARSMSVQRTMSNSASRYGSSCAVPDLKRTASPARSAFEPARAIISSEASIPSTRPF
jgi:hypothetical protein